MRRPDTLLARMRTQCPLNSGAHEIQPDCLETTKLALVGDFLGHARDDHAPAAAKRVGAVGSNVALAEVSKAWNSDPSAVRKIMIGTIRRKGS